MQALPIKMILLNFSMPAVHRLTSAVIQFNMLRPTETSWQVSSAVPALTSIGAGKYFLISLAGGSTGVALTPDFSASTTINLSGTAGKVALVNTNTALTGSTGSTACGSPTVVDVVGYGSTATCYEGTGPAPGSGVTSAQAIFRKLAGCTQTTVNSADFEVLTVNPRNSSSPANTTCGGGSPSLSAAPGSFTVAAVFGSNSGEYTYSLSGSSLSAGPIAVTPSGGIQISLTTGGPYTTGTLNVPYTAPTLSSTPVYFIIDNTAAAGAFSGAITDVGGSTSVTVNVTGSIIAAEPTVQASNINVSNISDNGFDVNWTNGDGASRIVVVKAVTVTTVNPADGTLYTVASATGTEMVQFVGTGGGPITVTGLSAGTNYSVRVYEYNEITGTPGTANYDTATAVNNPVTALTTGLGQNISISNFTAISVPLYMGSNVVSGNNNARIPVLFFAKVSGLAASTLYRYYAQGALSSDVGTANTAGGALSITYPVAGSPTFSYATTGSLTTAGSYGTFTTDASGGFSGAFGFVPTGNVRFTGGNSIIPALVMAKDATPTVTLRVGLNQTITVLNFGTPIDSGTFIHGLSSATAGNVVGLWKSTDGSSFINSIARPLAMTLVEHPAIGGATWGAAPPFVVGYDQTAGAWNTIIPNNNAAGVQLIQQIDPVTGNTIGCNSAAGGNWPSGAVTANPA